MLLCIVVYIYIRLYIPTQYSHSHTYRFLIGPGMDYGCVLQMGGYIQSLTYSPGSTMLWGLHPKYAFNDSTVFQLGLKHAKLVMSMYKVMHSLYLTYYLLAKPL